MNERSKSIWSRWLATYLLLLPFSFVFGLSFGNVGNQGTYLVQGLRLARPELLATDWWATETLHYHQAFSLIVYLADQLGPLPWTLAIINALTIAAGLAVLLALIRQLEPRGSLSAFLLLLVLVALDRTGSAGETYVFSGGLQASSFSALGLLLGIVCFLRGAFLQSGAWLAVSGAFHLNFLVLGFPAFGIAHAMLGWRGLIRRGIAQFALCSLPLALALPNLLESALSENAALARDILIHVRAPHHYLTSNFAWDLLPLAGWILLGSAALGSVSGQSDTKRRFAALFLSLSCLLGLATVLTTVVFQASVAQLFVLRLAPFAVLLSQLGLIVAAHRMARDPALAAQWLRSPLSLALAASGGLLIFRYSLYHHPILSLPVLLLAGFFGCLAALASRDLISLRVLAGAWKDRYRTGLRLATVGVFAATSLFALAEAYRASALVNPQVRPAAMALFEWVRTTESDSLFLLPPSLGPLDDFRVQGERAAVVDWKSMPMMPDEVVAWRDRWRAVLGVDELDSLERAAAAYRDLTAGQIRAAMALFDADYAVFFRPKAQAPSPGPIAYRNERFVVFGR